MLRDSSASEDFSVELVINWSIIVWTVDCVVCPNFTNNFQWAECLGKKIPVRSFEKSSEVFNDH